MATPYITSCGISLTSIDGVDCIGDSRGYINNNIQNLGTAICTVSGLTNFNVQDSNTIDLTWQSSTRTLSADVKPDSIRYSQLAAWQPLSASPTLSAEAVQPRLVKAWVNFDGNTLTIRDSFNISSISRASGFGSGVYVLTFRTPFRNSNFAGSGTAAGAPGYQDVNVQTSPYSESQMGVSIIGPWGGGGWYNPDAIVITVMVVGN